MTTKPTLNDTNSATSKKPVKTIIKPFEKDLGEFTVRRTLPTKDWKKVGPWVFFDHMGPVTFPAGEGISVRPHPHINLATVTYVFEGEILHRDSLGNTQTIRPGDINLMVAGRGITHSERETEEVNSSEHRLHGLQLWLALPEEDEETDPAFYHYPEREIPHCIVEGVPLRVMIGSAYGLTSPVKMFARTLYVEAHLQKDQSLVAPKSEELAVYVAQGQIEIDGEIVPKHSMAVLSMRSEIRLTATEESRVAFVGGESIGDRHLDWNFVSSRPERIRQARKDWKEGKFPLVVGDEKEFIPLPE